MLPYAADHDLGAVVVVLQGSMQFVDARTDLQTESVQPRDKRPQTGASTAGPSKRRGLWQSSRTRVTIVFGGTEEAERRRGATRGRRGAVRRLDPAQGRAHKRRSADGDQRAQASTRRPSCRRCWGPASGVRAAGSRPTRCGGPASADATSAPPRVARPRGGGARTRSGRSHAPRAVGRPGELPKRRADAKTPSRECPHSRNFPSTVSSSRATLSARARPRCSPLLLRPRYPDLRYTAYSCPGAVVSRELAAACDGLSRRCCSATTWSRG